MNGKLRHIATVVLVLAVWSGSAERAAAQARTELPAADRIVALRATDVFTVGVVDGPPHETFANVFTVAFDDDGNLYVLDTGNHRIVVFDRTGKHVRTIGRQGGGPGEFLAPVGLTITRDGHLVVNDAARGGLQVLTRTGEYVRTVPFQNGRRALSRLETHPAGGVVTETEVFDSSPQETLPASTGARSVTWIPFTDVTPQSLYNMAPQATVEAQISGAGGGEGALFAVMPPVFSPRLSWTTLPDGRVAASSGLDYRVTITDQWGKPMRLLERPITARKVTERDKQRYSENTRNSRPVVVTSGEMQRSSGGGLPVTAMPAPTAFAERMPVINRLIADPNGRIWVQRQDRETSPPLIDLLTADAKYLGTLQNTELPSAFGPGGVAAYIRRDELGVQRVVVRRITIE